MEGEVVFKAGTFGFQGDGWKATVHVPEDIFLSSLIDPLMRMAEEVLGNGRESGAR